MSRKTCWSPVGRTLKPVISPRSLTYVARNKRNGESDGIKVFKSTMDPFSHRKAPNTEKSHDAAIPTICVFELIHQATLSPLSGSMPGKVPRSVFTPFRQRYACDI